MSDEKDKEIAQQVVECWIEDCETLPPLTTEQLEMLLYHVMVGIMRGRE